MPAQTQAAYASIQAIRESAGLSNRQENETPVGVINGANKSFNVKRRPIVDTNYDDVVGPEDVHAFVDDVPVVVESVIAAEGTIVLAGAPGAGSRVTVDYSFSPLADEYVVTKQLEANDWVNMKIKGMITVPLKDPIPGIITTAAEMYAAGIILTRDWGSRVDSELTSKDGFNKIKQARELIADYLQGLKDERDRVADKDGSNSTVSTLSDGDVFGRVYDEDSSVRGGHTDDDFFMRRQ